MGGGPESRCRAKETSINYIIASSCHFTLFHDEDARSNNPQTYNYASGRISFNEIKVSLV